MDQQIHTPGQLDGEALDIVSAFEAYGQFIGGSIDQERFDAVVERACPGPGACGGMYTANTRWPVRLKPSG